MRLYELLESLDKDQKRVGQVGGGEKARKIGPVLGKAPKKHPYDGRLVGENVEEVDEAQVATMRKYFAGDKNAQDELKITKMRQYFDDLRKKEEEELKRKKELQKSVQIGGNIKEVAPPGMEDWIKDRKADFKKRYGDRWKTVLYATAWKRHKNESLEQDLTEADNNKVADRYDQDEWDQKIQRLKKLAGAGPLKTVWDPVKQVYKNVPVNQNSIKPKEK